MYGESCISIAHLPHRAHFDRPKYIYIGFLSLGILLRDESIVCLHLFLLKNQFTVLVATRPKI